MVTSIIQAATVSLNLITVGGAMRTCTRAQLGSSFKG